MSEQVPLEGLTGWPDGPRLGDTGAIARSLDRNGQYRPVVINMPARVVLVGWHTCCAARHLGWDTIDAVFVTVDDEQAARIVAADNRTSDLGSYNQQSLADLLSAAAADDLDGTGYDGDDLDDLLAGVGLYDTDLDDDDGGDGGGGGDPGGSDGQVKVGVGTYTWKVDADVLGAWVAALGDPDSRESVIRARLGL